MTRLEELNEQIAIHEQRGPAGGELDALKAERDALVLAEQKPGSPAEVDEDTVGGKTIDETPAA